MRSRTALGTLVLILMMVPLGLPTSGSSAAPTRGGTLVFSRTEDNTTLDPVKAVKVQTIYVLNHIFETLYQTSSDGRGTEPWLATGVDVSPDQLTWTFHLRSNVRFSDGNPMTSADVKFSLDRARTDKSGFGYLDDAIDAIMTPNPSTVVIRTKYPWKPFLADLALWANAIIPRDFGGKSADDFFKDPVGTGPFKLDHWTRGQELKVVRNPNYWQSGKPYLDAVVWTQVPDDNTRILQLKGGQAQITTPAFTQMVGLRDTKGIVAKGFAGTRVSYIIMNEHAKPFDDVHVRRAIAFAIDKQAMARAALFGQGVPACSIIAPTVAFYDPNTPCLTHDLQRAKAELSRSSVPKGFNAEFLIGGGDLFQGTIAQIVQGELDPLGIHVTIKAIDPGQVYQTTTKYEYQMAQVNWTMDIPDPDEQISFMLDPEKGGGESYSTGYNDPQMVGWVRAAEREFDLRKRQALYSGIQAKHAAEVPQIPILFATQSFAYSDRVHGFFVNPMGNRHLEDVWLEK
jgi:peptide/nickel transport system substrate-binding protein